MMATLYAHLPGLQLDEPVLPFAGGRLARVPFDEWIALESEFHYADRRYAGSEPVFWISEVMVEPEFTEPMLSHLAADAIWPVHTAFLLDARAPLLPTPTLSCVYLVMPVASADGERAIARFMGPMEREFLVYGSPLRYTYDAGSLAAVEARYRLLRTSRVQQRGGDALAGIEVLEETARPDSWYRGDQELSRIHGFVRCMAATESLLLPPEDERVDGEITQTFGRHAAMLLGASPSGRDEASAYFASLYRFRSDLMHGRSVPDEADPAIRAQLSVGRQLLCHAVCAALLADRERPDRAPLWQELRDAWAVPDHPHAITSTLARGLPA